MDPFADTGPQPGGGRPPWLVPGLVALLVVGLVGAFAVGRATRNTGAAVAGAGSSPSASPVVTPSADPSPSPDPSTSVSVPAGPVSQVEKGLHQDFGFARATRTVDGWVHVTFDRATLLTGKAANDYAKAHGMESPVPNDYLIVNDNPKLRDLVLAPSVTITGTAHLAGGTSTPQPVTLPAFLAVLATDHGVPLDVTFDSALRVTAVAEPFFP